MKSSKSRTVKVWAWSVSIGVHVVLFAIFAVIRFTNLASADVTVARVTTAAVKRAIDKPPVIAKPKVRPPSLSSRKPNNPLDLAMSGRKTIPLYKPSAKIASSRSASLLPKATVAEPNAEFFGSSSNMRKICYVVDCSGSMHGVFSNVRKQLIDSINTLKADQFFYVIFFREDKLIESGAGKFQRATERAKREVRAFIDTVQIGGNTNALNAIKRSMEITDINSNPTQQIYFLTDGFDLNPSDSAGFGDIIENFRKKLAPEARINTIGFWIQTSDEIILRSIAEASDGQFVNITGNI